MIFLGFLLALVAIAAAVIVIRENSGPAELTVLGDVVPGVTNQWQAFAAGCVVAIVFMTGVIAATMGIIRSIRLHQELRELRDEHDESVITLAMERRRLQRELARMRERATGQPQDALPERPQHAPPADAAPKEPGTRTPTAVPTAVPTPAPAPMPRRTRVTPSVQTRVFPPADSAVSRNNSGKSR